jgi:tetratricopeptide (TPR) repeat protein
MVQITVADAPVFNRAVSAYRTGRLVEAEELCRQVVDHRPDFLDAIFLLAEIQSKLGKNDSALASYDRILALRPGSAAALSNRGNVLQALRRYGEALASYERALALQPTYAVAYYNRGNTLQDLERYDEALASYEQALALQPDLAQAFSNRGNVLQKLKRFAEAVASYNRAIDLQPDYAEALSNRGAALQELKRYDEALASYSRAIAVSPDYADAHFNAAISSLLLGDFERGWEKAEWRWKTGQLANSRRSFKQPLWLGQSEIADKVIFLYAEQGFGDTIQFCRYVPLVAERGARVVLEVQEPLRGLMSSLAGTTQVFSAGAALPDFDVQCPLLSLPLAFGTRLETIPSAAPYLHAPASAVIDWDARLGPKRGLRIGLVWSGRPTHINDRNRSIRLSALLPLLDIDATFVSLQKDVRPDERSMLNDRSDLLHFGDALTDFSATAALIANLDLVISVDTSVAHLAGALAKPVWILLPFTPDWRWLLDRLDSPWYPTARLFRQDGTRTWDGVIARVHQALGDFIQSRSGG